MNQPDDKPTQHEALAEAVVFAHEPDSAPATSAELAAFERSPGSRPPPSPNARRRPTG